MVDLDEHMTETVLTIITAYGFFLLAEHYLGVSGVIATVVAGLFIGNRGAEHAMSPQTKISIFNPLSTGALIVNTFIFLAIGINTPVGDLAANAGLIVAAILLVLAVRIAIVYPLAAVVNRVQRRNVSVRYQHALVWGALHGSIPIALVLGLTPELPPGGEAAGDGLRGRRVQPRRPGADDAVTDGPARRRDPLGRERVIRTAHRTCSCRRRRTKGRRTTRTGREPSLRRLRGLHRGVRTREGWLERRHRAVAAREPELRHEELLVGERRVLQQEKSALMDAMRRGIVSDDVGDRLTEEVDIKFDLVNDGESTVEEREEGYEEFWRSRAAEFGIDFDIDTADVEADADATDD
jgi:CPA1 family monovalent cation:H+ antiporter